MDWRINCPKFAPRNCLGNWCIAWRVVAYFDGARWSLLPFALTLGDHLVRQLPPVTLEPNYQFRPDTPEGSYRIVVVETNACRQQQGNVFGQAAGQFLQHALFGRRARDGLPSSASNEGSCEVMLNRSHTQIICRNQRPLYSFAYSLGECRTAHHGGVRVSLRPA